MVHIKNYSRNLYGFGKTKLLQKLNLKIGLFEIKRPLWGKEVVGRVDKRKKETTGSVVVAKAEKEFQIVKKEKFLDQFLISAKGRKKS